MANIATIKPIEQTVEIMHPQTEQPIGIRVRVMSIEDDRLKRIKRTITDERLKLDAKGKALKTEDVERNGEKLLFGATLGWEWYNPTGDEGDAGYDPDAMPDFNGKVPDFTQIEFTNVIRELPWFAEQLREKIDETKSFFVN